ncbi:MAG TPA: hypothetical protein VMR86_15745 [Myxococcota bacterium]|nr:hypothetical protein [Myxococcota bacterium]
MPKSLAILALTACLSFLPGAARADVYMLEILQLRSGVSAHHASTYLGALELIARRHGGVRVSHPDAPSVSDNGEPRVVALWRFRKPADMDALLADPNYATISRLRTETFEALTPSDLELIARAGYTAASR